LSGSKATDEASVIANTVSLIASTVIPPVNVPPVAGTIPVKDDASPVYDVAAHVPVISTPVLVVVNLADAECLRETDESAASDIALSLLCLCCILSY
jgi:hypothetical protein